MKENKCKHYSIEVHLQVYDNEVGIYATCKDCKESYNHMYSGDDAQKIIERIDKIPFTNDTEEKPS